MTDTPVAETPAPAAGELVATPEGDQGLCECGAKIVILRGRVWCSRTLEKFRALHGEPT